MTQFKRPGAEIAKFIKRAENPSPATGTAQLFAKDSEGTTKLYLLDDAGTVIEVGAGSAGTFFLPEIWVQNNVAVDQTNVALSAQVSTNFDSIRMAGAGSIVGIGVRFSETITDGSVTIKATINGTPTTLASTATSGTGTSATQNMGIDTYVAGDLIGAVITTNGTFAPTTNDVEVWIQVADGTLSGGGSDFTNSDVQYDISADPASPNAMDDEFNGPTLDPKWIVFGTAYLDTPNYTLANSCLTLNRLAAGSNQNIVGVRQAFTPGADAFAFEIKTILSGLITVGGGSSFVGAGLYLGDGTKALHFGCLTNGSNIQANQNFQCSYWNSDTSWNSTLGAFTVVLNLPFSGNVTSGGLGWAYTDYIWMRISRAASSNTVVMGVSLNGYDWRDVSVTNVLTNIGAIQTVGVQLQNGNGGASKPRFFHFRKTG